MSKKKKPIALHFVTLRMPEKLAGGEAHKLQLKLCKHCSEELGGAVYHTRQAKCWFDPRARVNEGLSRSQKI